MRSVAQRFRKLAVQMGGVMIKVGQFLSARLDVLPREITDELSDLQDEVPPDPFEPIRALIESEFGMALEQKFSDFKQDPMASASIGQVYLAHLCATMEDGNPCPAVVVKVQRPHIEEVITRGPGSAADRGRLAAKIQTHQQTRQCAQTNGRIQPLII